MATLFPSWLRWEIQSCRRVITEASLAAFLLSSSLLHFQSQEQDPLRQTPSPQHQQSICLPLFLTYTHMHTHSHRVYISFIQPAGGRGEEKNTQQRVFSHDDDESIYSTKEEKDRLRGHIHKLQQWSLPIVDWEKEHNIKKKVTKISNMSF